MGRKRKNDWKNRDGVVYSTSDNFEYSYEGVGEEQTPEPRNQNLKVSLDSKARAGKQVTLIEGFVGTAEDLKNLEKSLKSRCGVGGSSKDGDILIQGDHRDKIVAFLSDMGYKVKRKGG